MSLDSLTPALPKLIPLHRVLDYIPSSRRGRKLSLATLYRWSARGQLPTQKIGGSRYVAVESLLNLMQPRLGGDTPPLNQPNARHAGDELDRLLSQRKRRRPSSR
jgi:hypothetical protein